MKTNALIAVITFFFIACNSNTKPTKSSPTTTTKSSLSTSTSVNGKYFYSDSDGVELSISVYRSSWNGKTKICGYCDVDYDIGVVKGKDLYDSSGYIKIGYISGNSLHTTIGSSSVTLRK
jgi:hypothetical protein